MDVVASLGFHLGEDRLFRRPQVDTDSVARLHERFGPVKSAHKGRDVLPSRLDAQVADRQRFVRPPFLDGVDDLLKDLFRTRLGLGQGRAFRDVVEAAVGGVVELHHRRATDDRALVLEDHPEGLPSGRAAKVRPPGGLHESGRGIRFEKAVPRLPPTRLSARRRTPVIRLHGRRLGRSPGLSDRGSVEQTHRDGASAVGLVDHGVLRRSGPRRRHHSGANVGIGQAGHLLLVGGTLGGESALSNQAGHVIAVWKIPISGKSPKGGVSPRPCATRRWPFAPGLPFFTPH